MISLELDDTDINGIVKAVRSLKHVPALEKLNEFRLTENNMLSLSQSFTDIPVIGFKTNVQLELSCDDSGKLLVRFVSLADNAAGNALINSFFTIRNLCSDESGVAGLVESKTKGLLVRVADDMLSWDPAPMKLKIRSVSVDSGMLSIKAEIH